MAKKVGWDAVLDFVGLATEQDVKDAERETREAERAAERAQRRAAQTRQASRAQQELAQQRLDMQIGVTHYTDKERAEMFGGDEAAFLDKLYSSKRDLVEEELVHTLEAIKAERGIQSPLPWTKIFIGVALVGGVGFGIYKVREGKGKTQSRSQRSPQRKAQKTL